MPDLEKISDHYALGEDFDLVLMRFNLRVVPQYFQGRAFLELGCSSGESTAALFPYADRIDIVEGSQKNIQKTTRHLATVTTSPAPEITFHSALWEDFEAPDEHYSDIIWFRGMEHLADPARVLARLTRALRDGGRLHLVVPNAMSLNRRVGVYMGMLNDPHELSPRDIEVGHQKMYDRGMVEDVFHAAGYTIIATEGILLKPFPNARMQELYAENPALVDAYFQVGHELPDYCTELYFCATPAK